MQRVGGVDGARGHWVLAMVDQAECTLQVLEQFSDVVGAAHQLGLAAVGVDMPIGLPSEGSRPSDGLAREVLGPRRSTLFPTPPRPVLAADTYDEANLLHRQYAGKGLSKQAFHLLPMIRQVRAAIGPEDRRVFHEAHPETTFTVLAGHPLAPKKSAAGVGQRLELLSRFVDRPERALAHAPEGCATDDALDAMVVAWSARRHLLGHARVFGSGTDADGYSLALIA